MPFQEILERDHERIPHLAGGRRPVLEQGQATELVAQDGRLARTRRRDGGSQGAQDDGRGKLVRVLDDPFQAPEMLEQDPARLYPRAKTRLVDLGEGDAGCGWCAHASALCQRRPGHTMENVITVPGGFSRGRRATLWVTLSLPRAPSSAAALSDKAFAVIIPFHSDAFWAFFVYPAKGPPIWPKVAQQAY